MSSESHLTYPLCSNMLALCSDTYVVLLLCRCNICYCLHITLLLSLSWWIFLWALLETWNWNRKKSRLLTSSDKYLILMWNTLSSFHVKQLIFTIKYIVLLRFNKYYFIRESLQFSWSDIGWAPSSENCISCLQAKSIGFALINTVGVTPSSSII